MHTTDTAPKGYTGPVRLTPEQKARTAANVDRWVQTLIQQAQDDTDPETQANAQLLLTNRGIGW